LENGNIGIDPVQRVLSAKPIHQPPELSIVWIYSPL
jgi:hypothetical protein